MSAAISTPPATVAAILTAYRADDTVSYTDLVERFGVSRHTIGRIIADGGARRKTGRTGRPVVPVEVISAPTPVTFPCVRYRVAATPAGVCMHCGGSQVVWRNGLARTCKSCTKFTATQWFL